MSKLLKMCSSSGTLIDEELLVNAILNQFSHDKLSVKAEDISFNTVRKLCLEYRKILTIDYLWEFSSLTTLKLNNNMIRRIEGLESLINLIELDLSFNKIEKIEGLESLQKLEALNLYKNKISVIENMDTLENLTYLTLADNLIGQMDNVLYLRKFKKLFSIGLFGCPVSEEDDYHLFIAGFFPNVAYLDYILLDEKTKNEASAKYFCQYEKMKREELDMEQAEDDERRLKAEAQLHTDAFVEYLNGSQLFESMVEGDSEIKKLHNLPDLAHTLDIFESEVVNLCNQLFEIGLDEHTQREKEANAFFSAQNDSMTVHRQKVAQILAEFEQRHKEWKVELSQLSDPELLKVKMNLCKDEMNQLSKSLMALELKLTSQMEEITREFDIKITEMINNFCATALDIFEQCQKLEEKNHETIAVSVEKLFDNIDNMPDHIEMVFTDKYSLMEKLTVSHDQHLDKINARSIQMVARANGWKEALLKNIEEKELERNRTCSLEIHTYVDKMWEQLVELH